ncbi:MAG: hypothetical protein ABIP48_24415 [Planctomycetota bacterium]
MAEPDFEPISSSLIHGIAARLVENRPVREALPGGAKLNIDRLLPFLCVYRRDPRRQDAGTGLFVTAEAAYLNAPGPATRRKGMRHLVRHISEAASSRLGAFLILEVWSISSTTSVAAANWSRCLSASWQRTTSRSSVSYSSAECCVRRPCVRATWTILGQRSDFFGCGRA